MKRTILRATILAAALTWALGFAILPAHAVTASTPGVKQCSGSSCTSVSSGAVVQGTIRISAHASETAVLQHLKWVRISARDDSTGAFTCLIQWTTSAQTYDNSTDWDTTHFRAQNDAPGCPAGSDAYNRADKYGAYTHNGALQIQVQAANNSNSIDPSGTFTVNINNPSSAPQWASNPSVSGTAQRQPVVTLSWQAVPEPDIIEYHFVRRDSSPDSSATEFAVSAASPQNQGCSLSNGVYTCHDSSFPATGFGGTYNYWVVAYRSSPSDADQCSASVGGGANCIQSPLSQQASVSMSEPAPSPSGSPSGGTTLTPGSHSVGGSRPTGVTPSVTGSESTTKTQSPEVLGSTVNREQFCFTCGSYGKTLPYGNNSLPGDNATGGAPITNGQSPILAAGPQLATGTGGTDPKQLWTSVAAGLVLLLTAAHVARVLRATAH
jgi:hypothetical protein